MIYWIVEKNFIFILQVKRKFGERIEWGISPRRLKRNFYFFTSFLK